jgi:hypothetical protein
MADFTKDAYEARIPACCERQTMEDHMSMMLCWGLAAAVRQGRKMDCSGCDLATRPIFFARDK